MKKLIALTLMVACLACFSLGCGEKDKKPTTTTPPTNTAPVDDDKPADTGAATDSAPVAP